MPNLCYIKKLVNGTPDVSRLSINAAHTKPEDVL